MEIDDILLVKYLTGEISEEEAAKVRTWESADSENSRYLRQIAAYWNADVSLDDNIECDYASLGRKIKNEEKYKGIIMKCAGLVAALFAGVLIGYFTVPSKETGTVSYVTGSGISSFVLPDCTEVTLNKNSILSYNGEFGVSDREVRLSGEGYFKVKYNEDKKFKVEMDGVSVTVLGTEFDVKNRPEENNIQVSLVTGSLLFEAGSQSIRLVPESMVSYDRSTEKVSVEDFDPDITTSWKENILRYKSVNIMDLLHDIAARKGVKLQIEDGVFDEDDIISGALETDRSFDQMLIVLSSQVPFGWAKGTDTYLIFDRHTYQ